MKISLKAARVNARLLQSDVADRIGVNRTTLANWESGKTSPDASQFVELCGIYDVSVDDVFLPSRST